MEAGCPAGRKMPGAGLRPFTEAFYRKPAPGREILPADRIFRQTAPSKPVRTGSGPGRFPAVRGTLPFREMFFAVRSTGIYLYCLQLYPIYAMDGGLCLKGAAINGRENGDPGMARTQIPPRAGGRPAALGRCPESLRWKSPL